MKKIKVENKSNILSKFMAERYFEDFNKSIVVLANPKTIINVKFAKREVKEKVIRGDQLVKYIKDMCVQSKESPCSEEKMRSWAQFYLYLHKNVEKDYTAKYGQYRIGDDSCNALKENDKTESIGRNEKEKHIVTFEEKMPVEETEIFKELKVYRLIKSREENIKPYFIYNDNQLRDIIRKMPKSIVELQEVNGFGEVKANKYGQDIISIVDKYFCYTRGDMSV